MSHEIVKELKMKLIRLNKKLANVNKEYLQESVEKTGENLITIRALLEEREKIELEIERVNDSIAQLEENPDSHRNFRISINGNLREISIVLPNFANPTKGHISSESPLAKALLKLKEIGTINYETPNGVNSCEVLDMDPV